MLSDDLLQELAREHGTPLWVYSADGMRERVARLAGFDVVRYAQKANPNLAVLRVIRSAGALVDAVSAGELVRALRAGFEPEEVVFTADLLDRDALQLLAAHPFGVNVGSPDMIPQLAEVTPVRSITLRINPGFGHGHDPRVEAGGEASKHGIWHASLPEVVAAAADRGLSVTGLHVHIGSGCSADELARVQDALRRLVEDAGPDLATISAGGGLPVRYAQGDVELDVDDYTARWNAARDEMSARVGRRLTLEVEPGRYLVAECGVLLCEVRGTKAVGSRDFVLVDAGFNDLVRPALYGAHHRITAVGASGPLAPRVVAGPLCESGDVFTRDRDGALAPQLLPAVSAGDLLCVHTVGAYGACMSSNYNGRPLAAEVLVDGGTARRVRRRQTLDELLALE